MIQLTSSKEAGRSPRNVGEGDDDGVADDQRSTKPAAGISGRENGGVVGGPFSTDSQPPPSPLYNATKSSEIAPSLTASESCEANNDRSASSTVRKPVTPVAYWSLAILTDSAFASTVWRYRSRRSCSRWNATTASSTSRT